MKMTKKSLLRKCTRLEHGSILGKKMQEARKIKLTWEMQINKKSLLRKCRSLEQGSLFGKNAGG